MDDKARLEVGERIVRVPRAGTKVTLIVAALLLVGAFYFALVPIQVQVGTGFWDCGNAFGKPSAADGGGFCGQSNAIHFARAAALTAAALVTAIGGFLTFGTETRVERRTRRAAADEF